MELFVLDGPFCDDGSEFNLYLGEWTDVGDAPKCSVCGKFYGALPSVPPIRGKLVAEKSMYDLSRAPGSEILLSERCLRAFEANGIRGLIDPNPIELLGVEGPIPLESLGRFFLARLRWGAEVDRVKSGLRTTEKEACSSCGLAGLIEAYDRVAIIEDSWNGHDLFTIKGLSGVVLVTDRVRKLCDDLKLTVCSLVPAGDSRIDFTMPPSISYSKSK